MTALWGKAALGKIFISHSSADKPFVRRRIETPLREAGYDTWLDEKELLAGDPLPRKVSEGIRDAKVVIVVISATSVESNWLRYELNIAADFMIKRGLRLIPVVVDDVRLPPETEGLLHADMRKNIRGGIRKIMATLELEASRYPQPPDPVSVTSESSYLRQRAYKDLLSSESDGGSFEAFMDLSATRSVDWSGITVRDVDVRVNIVHSYGRKIIFSPSDFDGWLGQLEETSSDFAILVIEGRLSGDSESKFDQSTQGVWMQSIPMAVFNGGRARIVVEVSPEGSADQAEGRLRDAVRLISLCIENREPSYLDAITPAREN
nr:hypothetical protein KitaXyl93_54850 [Kitasatospora sp. Xyl93]